jgi:hypothetical protein
VAVEDGGVGSSRFTNLPQAHRRASQSIDFGDHSPTPTSSHLHAGGAWNLGSLIAILIAGFIIVAALVAVDVLDIR